MTAPEFYAFVVLPLVVLGGAYFVDWHTRETPPGRRR